jgi:hypothetical protein
MRPIVIFNRVGTTVDAVVSQEVGNGQEIQVLPRPARPAAPQCSPRGLAIQSRGRLCRRLVQLLLRHRPATDMAALIDQNRSDRRVCGQQCRRADCGAVLMGSTDGPARMRNGMIQIKIGA